MSTLELTKPVGGKTSTDVASAPPVAASVADLIGYDSPVGSKDERLRQPSPKTQTEFVSSNGTVSGSVQQPPVLTQLPVLRSELILEPAQFDKTGQPKWTLQDPIRGKYYRLGWLEFELLSRWSLNDANAVIDSVNAETTLRVHRGHLDSLVSMLTSSELIQPITNEDFQKLGVKATQAKRSALKSAFSLSMFYRRPLVNPDTFLTTLDRVLSPFYAARKLVLFMWLILAAVALNGVASHWFEFRSTFTQFMTLEGFALFAVVLIFVNAFHEIGHGLVAKHYQCRVTEMGVALIFMLPVCYCDTSDTWRLSDNSKRLMVSAGGMLMELAIATVACLMWLVLPDGIPRTLAFFLAVTSLATTLFINLNPFMKFDGYYLLADALGVDNLQTKSFSNFRWQLRQWFAGSVEEQPYRIPESSHKVMNFYALATWVYRLVLYFSICWMVYQFWFKALGLVLMTGVFMTMIAAPVVKESALYAEEIRKNGLSGRAICTGLSVFLILALLAIPLPRKVSAPAVLSTATTSKLFATTAAKVNTIQFSLGDTVTQGQTLLTLENPELEYQKVRIETELATLKSRKLLEAQWLAGNVTTQVSEFDINARMAELQEVTEQINSLKLVASSDSTVTTVPGWLKEGVWVNTNTVLAELTAIQETEIRAYVAASKSSLLDTENATFFANSGGKSIDLNIQAVGSVNVDVLTDLALAVSNGGEMATLPTSTGELQPVQGWVTAVLTPAVGEKLELTSERIGYVMFSAEPKSLISSVADRLYGVVIRESGF